jgi:diguanylate cyclase (GGDEF)-like protein/PAS domain S-box-containing protein
MLAERLKTRTLENARMEMQHVGRSLAGLASEYMLSNTGVSQIASGTFEFHITDTTGVVSSSNLALFHDLQNRFAPQSPSQTNLPDFDIYIENSTASILERMQRGYWVHRFVLDTMAAPQTTMTVLQPSDPLLQVLNHQMADALLILLGLLVVGALASELLGGLLQGQFRHITWPMVDPAAGNNGDTTGPDVPRLELAGSSVQEINTLVQLVNTRSRSIQELMVSLRSANAELTQVQKRLATALQQKHQSEVKLRSMLEFMPTAVAVYTRDVTRQLRYVNQQYVRSFGYSRSDVATFADWTLCAYPDPRYREKALAAWDAALHRAVTDNTDVELIELLVNCKDGSRRETLMKAIVVDDLILVVLMDISPLRKTERELRSTREALEQTAYELTENIPVGTYAMVLQPGATLAEFSFVSTRFLELTGVTADEALGSPFNAFARVHPDDRDEWLRRNVACFEQKTPFFGETRMVVNGEIRWIMAESFPRHLHDGTTIWEGVLMDITPRMLAQQAAEQARAQAEAAQRSLEQANQELRLLATTDTLTGARNRRFFETRADDEIQRGERYASCAALVIFDIDHFKSINDQYGHIVGDQVLIELARRVQCNLRAVDVFARWGGEEFIVMLPAASPDAIVATAEKLRNVIAVDAFPVVGTVTASFGIAVWNPGESRDDWVKRADHALYLAKAAGRNCVVVAPAVY